MVSQEEADAAQDRIKKLIKRHGKDSKAIARVRATFELWRKAPGDAMAYALCVAEIEKLEAALQ